MSNLTLPSIQLVTVIHNSSKMLWWNTKPVFIHVSAEYSCSSQQALFVTDNISQPGLNNASYYTALCPTTNVSTRAFVFSIYHWTWPRPGNWFLTTVSQTGISPAAQDQNSQSTTWTTRSHFTRFWNEIFAQIWGRGSKFNMHYIYLKTRLEQLKSTINKTGIHQSPYLINILRYGFIVGRIQNYAQCQRAELISSHMFRNETTWKIWYGMN